MKKFSILFIAMLTMAIVLNTSVVVAQGPDEPEEDLASPSEQLDEPEEVEDISGEVSEPEEDILAEPEEVEDISGEVSEPEEDILAEPEEDLASGDDNSLVEEPEEDLAADPASSEDNDLVAEPEEEVVVEEVEDLAVDTSPSDDVSPSELPSTGWWTSATFQNLSDSSDASAAFTAYPGQGQSFTQKDKTVAIGANSNVTFLPFSGTDDGSDGSFELGIDSGFVGSMVATSDQPLAGVGQVGNNSLTLPGGSLGTSGGYASALYRGSSTGSEEIFYPTVKSNFFGKSTTLYVQAAGSEASINATLSMNDGTQYTFTGSIDANKTRIISVADFSNGSSTPPTDNCGDDGNTSPCLGAVTVTANSGQTIVGAVVEHPHSGTATQAQAATMFTDSDAGETILCPVYKSNWAGRYSGITVQNVTGNGQSVTVGFSGQVTDGGSGTKTTTLDIDDGKSKTFHPFDQNDGGVPDKSVAAVTLSVPSGSKIVAAVNEANFSGTRKAVTYTCFNPENATSSVALPLVKEAYGGGNITGVSVQYAGDAGGTTNVTAVYKCDDGNTYTHVAKAIGDSSSTPLAHTYYLPSSASSNWSGTAMSSNKNCAVSLTTDDGDKIVAIANEAKPSGSLDNKTYEGFNK